MEKRRIEVVDYDHGWPRHYEQEAARLSSAFGSALVQSFHVGSTSVPGLAAKPTIDILVEVETGTQIQDFYPEMAHLGYECRGECLDAVIPGTPGRHYFVAKEGVAHRRHVHVCATGHEDIRKMVTFRDYLRSHPPEAQEYAALKIQLSSAFEYDNIGYMNGKDAFIKTHVEKALGWMDAQ